MLCRFFDHNISTAVGMAPPPLFYAFFPVPPFSSVVSLFKKNERNSSGVLEWNSVEEACDALIFCNHTVIPSPGDRVPFVMRLAFSSSGAAERRYSRAPIGSGSSSNGWHLSSGKVPNATTGGAAPPSAGSAASTVAAGLNSKGDN